MSGHRELPPAAGDETRAPSSSTDLGDGPVPPVVLDPDHDEASGGRGRRRRWSRLAGFFPPATLAVVLYLVPLPYFVVSPGPARDVLPLIEVGDQQRFPTDGRFLLTTVFVDRANVYEAVRGWIDTTHAVVPEDTILAPGETEDESGRKARSEMDTSKIDAAIVALTAHAGYPEEHGRGVLVEAVLPDSPAEGRLFPGDLILEIDGRPVDSPDRLGAIVRAAGVGTPLVLTVEAGGERERVEVAPGRVPNVGHPVIGIAAVHAFPFPVSIRSGDVGGPSAGLMWALGLTDLITPGDLTAGRVVAGTGTIAADGTVGPVGGIEEKVISARRAGANVFIVPRDNEESARSVAGELPLVPVSSYGDALAYLQGQG